MRKRLSLLLCISVAVTFLSSGCTPSTEIKQLAIVEGVAVDQKADGSYLLTYQIFDPSGGGGGGEGGGEKNAQASSTKIVQCSGESLFDASRNATKQMGKKLYYSNVRAVIIGKEVCEKNFLDLMDFLERNHEIPPSQRIFMAEDKAADVLMAQGKSGNISAEELAVTTQNSNNTSEVLDQTLSEIEGIVSSQTTDISLPIVSVENATESGTSGGGLGKNKSASGSTSSKSSVGGVSSGSSSSSSSQSSSGSSSGKSSSGGGSTGGSSSGSSIFIIKSSAVFSNNKLVGRIDSKTTRGILWVQGLVQSGVIDVYVNNKVVALEIQTAKSKVSVEEKTESLSSISVLISGPG